MELYRKLDCSQYDAYCHGCPAEHLPAEAKCLLNVVRDEQAERDAALGAAVMAFLHTLRSMSVGTLHATAHWARAHDYPVTGQLWDIIADALEAQKWTI